MAEDASGAVGRRATTCATAAIREVFECCMLDGLLTKDGRLEDRVRVAAGLMNSVIVPDSLVFRTVSK